MNSAQIHLALNHAPLFLSAVGGVILLLGYIKKNNQFKTLSYFFLVTAALVALPVFFTGEGTEELVENLPGINEGVIEKHENMAKVSMIIIAITGISALLSLLLHRKTEIIKVLSVGTLLFSLASFGTMAQTAHLGGLIRHAELQNGNAASDNKEDEESEKKKSEDESVKPTSQYKQLPDSIRIEKKEKDDDD